MNSFNFTFQITSKHLPLTINILYPFNSAQKPTARLYKTFLSRYLIPNTP